MTRTGVFLCTCDGQIGRSIDMDAVSGEVQANGTWVTLAPHVCLPAGIREMENAIASHGIDRVVVAACAARFQENRLRRACASAGINANLFTLVDWREGCALPHPDDRENATAQAVDLVRMGIARVENADPVQSATSSIYPAVVVIGGGIAGMTAARVLADRGIAVTLVEQDTRLGGAPHRSTFDGAAEIVAATVESVLHHTRIDTRLDSRVIAVGGAVGDHRLVIRNGTSGQATEVRAGAVIVATGTQEYRPAGLYHHDARRVLTLEEFEKEQSETYKVWTSLVYILCAGSRDQHIPYCSRTCCIEALHQALRVRHAHPGTHITILFRDLYLLGDAMNDEVVHRARRAGIAFARYDLARLPQIKDDAVIVRDELTGRDLVIPCDRVVLATAQVPREDAGVLAHLLNLPRDEDGFFVDPHWRLRPERKIERGIFISGSAHRPVDTDTATLQGLTTAARAARFISSGVLHHPGWSATVQAALCTGCAQCVETCTFSAIRMVRPARGDAGIDHAVIDPYLCHACGNCVVACPSRAIGLPNSSDAQIFAQIDASFAQAARTARTIVFACTWSGFAAMELAGARRLSYPAGARVIELPCSARLDPLHVLYAFFSGAERVVVTLCPPDECHFGNGNRSAQARLDNLREQLSAHGIDPRRLVVAPMMGDDSGQWVVVSG